MLTFVDGVLLAQRSEAAHALAARVAARVQAMHVAPTLTAMRELAEHVAELQRDLMRGARDAFGVEGERVLAGVFKS
jgi:hypothetical protein